MDDTFQLVMDDITASTWPKRCIKRSSRRLAIFNLFYSPTETEFDSNGFIWTPPVRTTTKFNLDQATVHEEITTEPPATIPYGYYYLAQPLGHSIDSFCERVVGWMETIILQYTRNSLISLTSLETLLLTGNPFFQSEFQQLRLYWRLQALSEMIQRYPERLQLYYQPPVAVVRITHERLEKLQKRTRVPNDTPYHIHSLTASAFDKTYHYTNSQRSFRSVLSKDAADAELLIKIVVHSWDILVHWKLHEAREQMKSVELANEVRQRVGSEGFQVIKRYFPGFLHLLERYEHLFQVERIPKEDIVGIAQTAVQDEILIALYDEMYHGNRGNFNVFGKTMPIPPSKSLYICNVSTAFTSETFAREFAHYRPTSTTLVSQRDRCYGFVNFATTVQAKRVKSALSRSRWRSKVEYSKRCQS